MIRLQNSRPLTVDLTLSKPCAVVQPECHVADTVHEGTQEHDWSLVVLTSA